MKEIRSILEMDESEQGMVITALNELRNDKLKEDKPTDFVDDMLIKVINAHRRKVLVLERDEAR
jgi:hypothetical protein